MLRFPNPGSDIDGFIRIFCALVDEFETAEAFDLDAMSQCLVTKNLATSSGYMGQEALRRSTRADRSRDPLYNQSKMYSELFRVLGWMQSLPDSHLSFRITLLGLHVRAANVQPRRLVESCLLGMAYPNPQVRVRVDQSIRPFACILRTMDALGGVINRDEMIVGPLTLENDRSSAQFAEMTKRVASYRPDSRRLTRALEEVSERRQISENTLKNYTRFPIGVLRWSSWADSVRAEGIYERPSPFLALTQDGQYAVRRLKEVRDVRARDLSQFGAETRKAFIRLSFYQMLEEAGFDISPVRVSIAADSQVAGGDIGNLIGANGLDVLFSPFQELSSSEVFEVLPTPGLVSREQTRLLPQTSPTAKQKGGPSQANVHLLPLGDTISKPSRDNSVTGELRRLSRHSSRSIASIVNEFVDQHAQDNQREFYPLVAQLFSSFGFPCEHSRAGVNYQRWDAMIIDARESIPIEIKSPGEELFLSVKGVRQALENKIILLARSHFPTTRAATSLVVGFNYPNDRSEVASLIDDIFAVYNIRLGVLDIKTLVTMAANAVFWKRFPRREELVSLIGFADVEST